MLTCRGRVVIALVLLKYVLLDGSHPAGPTKIVGKRKRGRLEVRFLLVGSKRES